MTMELLRNISAAASHYEFLLLTSPSNHALLASLDSRGMTRVCVQGPREIVLSVDRMAVKARSRMKRIVPASFLDRLGKVYRKITEQPVPGPGPLPELEADLLFCPFTAPSFVYANVPIVAIVYDLQHLVYPQFFDTPELRRRERGFRLVRRTAARIVCISEWVRKTVLAQGGLPERRVVTIPIQLSNRLSRFRPAAPSAILNRLGLRPERYLLYPANYWRHKNHELLLSAFAMYRAANPLSDLKLVFTGTPGERQNYLAEAARIMGIDDAVVFAGFVPDEEFAALLELCLAVVFPSLFEGFGMPVLEAMAAGKPVLASNTTSLPEVAAGAVLFFDPRRPREVCDAILEIEGRPDLRGDLVAKGLNRVASLGTPDQMARQYLQVFSEVIQEVKSQA